MGDISDRLALARAHAAEAASLDARLRAVRAQIEGRVSALAEARRQLQGEEADVRALEGMSLGAMFATMLGTKEKQLAAERADVLRATLARDACADALRALEADEASLREKLGAMGGVAGELASAFQAKEADLIARGDATGHRLAEIDALAADARAVVREVGEAVAAGNTALRALDKVSAALDSARNWGTFDLLGGGTIATWAKHSRIDDARGAAHAAQTALDRFARESADVSHIDAHHALVEIGGFATFADYFFDGLIADWFVQEKIATSRANVASVHRQVVRARDRLAARLAEIREEFDALAAERTRIVEQG